MINISGKTKIVGVIGEPVTHSRSPQMHNAAIAKLGLNFAYLPFEVKLPDLATAIQGLKALQVVGVNVTIPHKQNVMPLLDHISTEAHLIGAVNTLVFDQDQIFGHNTDAEGFIRAMQEEASLCDYLLTGDVRAVVLGAGGAARAIIAGLAKEKARHVTIVNRTTEHGLQLKEFSGSIGLNSEVKTIEEMNEFHADYDLIINSSSLGLKNESSPIPIKIINQETVVYDIVYKPVNTELIKESKKKNAEIIYGYEMLLGQAVRSFEIWLEQKAPYDEMKKALLGGFS